MRHLVFRCLFYLQVHRLARYLNRHKVRILMYHGFSDGHGRVAASHYDKHLDVDKFTAQLAYLKAYYTVLPLEEWLRSARRGQVIENAAIITIDDGYGSTYTLAYPILRQHAAPAIVFLATDFVDNKAFLWTDRIEHALHQCADVTLELSGDPWTEPLRHQLDSETSRAACEAKLKRLLKSMDQTRRDEGVRDIERALKCKLSAYPELYRPLSWPEIREMQDSGLISFGSHTHRHAIMARCSPKRMREEVEISRQIIEERLSRSCSCFCYPNGAAGDFDELTRATLRETGYECGLTTVEGLSDASADLYELKRIDASDQKDLIEFAMALCGVKDVLKAFKRTIHRLIHLGRTSKGCSTATA